MTYWVSSDDSTVKRKEVDRKRAGKTILTPLHSDRPKLYAILAFLSAKGLKSVQGLTTRVAEDRAWWKEIINTGFSKYGICP